jgi:septal ring factor EnvC (AmiA/AmiB activator)
MSRKAIVSFSRRYIAVFVLLIVVTLFSPVWGQKKSEQLKKNKHDIEVDIANTQKLLNQTRQNKDNSLQQLSVLRKQIANREELITALNMELLELEEELVLNIKLAQSLDKKLSYMKSDYERVVYMAYKNRKMVDKLTFLLSSETFSQIYRRFKYYALFSSNVTHQVELIKQTKVEIEKKNREIIALKEQKTNILTGKEIEIRELETNRNEKAKTADELKKKEKKLAEDLKAKQKKRKELDAAIKKAIQDEIAAANAKKAAAARAKNAAKNKPATSTKPANSKVGSGDAASKASTTGSTTNSNEISLTPEEKVLSNLFVNNQGKLPWPVAQGVKTGDFGNYPHPDIPSIMIENRGIDILTTEEAEVRSVFDGEVTWVSEVLGTKVLMIRHGEYLTVYQNLTKVKVQKGDKVRTKQVVATVAKSSTALGYELHFEVWKNNNYLNPNKWLSKR